jgi:hypothetical protein
MTGIVDLVAVCVAQRQWSQRLFERCGAWVATSEHPGLQQLLATATHRHAWHAELWSRRRPTIPVDDPPAASPDEQHVELDGDAARAAAYANELESMLTALDRIRAASDPTLDPATHRTLDLVTTDLLDLRQRLTEVASAL